MLSVPVAGMHCAPERIRCDTDGPVDPTDVLSAAPVAEAIEAAADASLAHASLTRIVEADPGVADVVRDDERHAAALVARRCARRVR